jgi:SPP1 family predicted phage head-tail adaptor
MNLNSKTTNPGELRTQIVLERPVLAENAGGFKAKSYSVIATVWAKWQNVHGSEVWVAESVQAVQPATVLIRYRADVDVTCAVSLGSSRYQIVSMDDIENRHEYIEMKVSRMVNG